MGVGQLGVQGCAVVLVQGSGLPIVPCPLAEESTHQFEKSKMFLPMICWPLGKTSPAESDVS